MNDKVKLALVGCGWISGAHVNGYKALMGNGCKEFEVTACCDLNENLARERAGEIAAIQGKAPKVFTDIQGLLDARAADAADICLPHCFHHTASIQLLEGGLHVLLEKPLGITIKASKKIIAAAARQRRVLATAENVRRDLASRATVWALRDAKLIGEVVCGGVHVISNNPLKIDDPKFKWRAIKLLTGGGMIMDGGAHFTDMMIHAFGDVEDVFCCMRTLDTREAVDVPRLGKAKVDVEDCWDALIRFKSGTAIHWTFSNCLTPVTEATGIYYGRNGSIRDHGWVFHAFQGGGTITLADKSTLSREQIQVRYLMQLSPEEKARLFPYGVTDGFGIEIWDFINSIRTNRQPEMDGHAGLRAKALCEACYESSTAGRAVKYNDVLEGVINAYQKPIDEFWEI